MKKINKLNEKDDLKNKEMINIRKINSMLAILMAVLMLVGIAGCKKNSEKNTDSFTPNASATGNDGAVSVPPVTESSSEEAVSEVSEESNTAEELNASIQAEAAAAESSKVAASSSAQSSKPATSATPSSKTEVTVQTPSSTPATSSIPTSTPQPTPDITSSVSGEGVASAPTADTSSVQHGLTAAQVPDIVCPQCGRHIGNEPGDCRPAFNPDGSCHFID